MKKLLLFLVLTASTAHAQWVFPTFNSIGDTSFYRIDQNLEVALSSFKCMLNLNGYAFEKRAYTPKDRIMYVIYQVDPKNSNRVYLFYLLYTRRGYETWYEYRTNQDCIIENDELTITYKRLN